MKNRLIALLRWSEKYTKTDMVYLAESGFWLQASSVFISLSSFLLYVVFGHVLSKEVYGTYQYLLSLGAIVGAFTMTGMSAAVVRAVARGFDGTFVTSIRTQLIWGIMPALGSWILGAYYLTHHNQTLGIGLLLIGVFVPISTTFNTFSAYLVAKKDFKSNFFYGLIINLPYYLSVALVAISLKSALALLAANLISQAIGYYIAYRRTLRTHPPNKKVDASAARYGTHLSGVGILTTIMTQIDNVLVYHLLGAAPLALYSFATAVPDRLSIFKNIAMAAFPKYAIKTHHEMLTSMGRKIGMGIGVTAIIAVSYIMLAHLFFGIFFPRYLEVVPYSQIYVLIIIFSFSHLFTTALTAHGHTRELYLFNTIAPILTFASITTGILWWGLWGLIVGRIVGAAFCSFLALAFFLFARRTIPRYS